MKSTSADDVIIQALCPGPGDDSALGAPLVMYASRSATRVARSGGAAAGPSAHATRALSAIAPSTVRAAKIPAVRKRVNRLLAFPIVGRPFVSWLSLMMRW